MMELMATEGVKAFCQLNGQRKDRRAGVQLPKGATVVLRKEAQWASRYIGTRRTGSACCPMDDKRPQSPVLFEPAITRLQRNYTKWLKGAV